LSLGVDEFRPVDGALKKTEGGAVGELLGLPKGWPE